MAGDDALLEMLEHIDATGVALVTGMPSEHLAVIRLAERIAFIEESHFGRWFDVESKPNPENLALYAAGAVPAQRPPQPHAPAGYPVPALPAERRAGRGTASWSIPSLRPGNCNRRDRAAFNLLSTHKVTFTYVTEDRHIVNRGCVIEIDEDGDIIGTRPAPGAAGTGGHRTGVTGAVLPAHRAFLGIVTSAQMQYRFRLNKGDCQVFDNHRIMHARSEFRPG